jgi:hypothetical protein
MTASVRKLIEILDACEDTGDFLQSVALAVEHVYSERVSGCPDGFRHLDRAIQSFEECEAEDADEDDEDEDEDDSDD